MIGVEKAQDNNLTAIALVPVDILVVVDAGSFETDLEPDTLVVVVVENRTRSEEEEGDLSWDTSYPFM